MNGQHFVTNFGNNNNEIFRYTMLKEVLKVNGKIEG
jgi:hypothetical protein